MIGTQFIDGIRSFAKELVTLDCKPPTIQHKIDGIMYTSTKLPCSVGLELWPRVVALLGAATRGVVTGDADNIGPEVLAHVADRAMRDGLVSLIRDLLKRTKCGELRPMNKPGDVLDHFDEHFSGEYGHLAKVCALVLAHNLRGPTLGGR